MDPESLKFILSLIEDHLIFYNRSTCPQISVESQQDITMFTRSAYLADFADAEQTTSGLKLPNIGAPGSGRHCRGNGPAEQLQSIWATRARAKKASLSGNPFALRRSRHGGQRFRERLIEFCGITRSPPWQQDLGLLEPSILIH